MRELYTITTLSKELGSTRITTSNYVSDLSKILIPKIKHNKVLYSINPDYTIEQIKELFKEKRKLNTQKRKTRWTV